MPIEIVTLVVLGSFFILLFLGLEVAFSLMSCALVFTLIFWTPSALYVAATSIYSQATKDIYLAVPLFIFMACLLESSGIGEDLFDIILKLFPRLPGSLGAGSVMMCTIVDAMSGLGGTGVVTIGVLTLPEMLKRGYDKRIALGCIPAGGSLGPLIPPSVLMILIGGMMGLSVGRLFAAGLIPGLIIAGIFILYIVVRCMIQPELAPSVPEERRVSWVEKLASLKGLVLPFILVVMVLGSIYTGIATPTEAAGVGAGGAAACGIINRRLSWAGLKKAMLISLRINCMVMWLLIAGNMFAAMLNATGIADLVVEFMPGEASPNLTIIMMMIIPLIMGMFIDGAAVSVICIPIFSPLVLSLGIDPYWFGTLFTISLIAGYLTPPFGMNLFYTKGIAPDSVTMSDIYSSIGPFIAAEIFVLGLVFLFPKIALWLPSLMK